MAIDRETREFVSAKLHEAAMKELDEYEAIKYEEFVPGEFRSRPASREITRRPEPTFWQRVRSELEWRIPQAWRVLTDWSYDGD